MVDINQILATIVIVSELYIIHFLIEQVWLKKLTLEEAAFACFASFSVLAIGAELFAGIGNETENFYRGITTPMVSFINILVLTLSLWLLGIFPRK